MSAGEKLSRACRRKGVIRGSGVIAAMRAAADLPCGAASARMLRGSPAPLPEEESSCRGRASDRVSHRCRRARRRSPRGLATTCASPARCVPERARARARRRQGMRGAEPVFRDRHARAPGRFIFTDWARSKTPARLYEMLGMQFPLQIPRLRLTQPLCALCADFAASVLKIQTQRARGDTKVTRAPATAARTAARCRRASARRRSGGRGCTGRRPASPPSGAAGVHLLGASAAGRRAPSGGRRWSRDLRRAGAPRPARAVLGAGRRRGRAPGRRRRAWPSSAGASRTSTAPGPNGSTTRPSARQLVGARGERAGGGRVEIDHQRHQQDLPLDAGPSRCRFSRS